MKMKKLRNTEKNFPALCFHNFYMAKKMKDQLINKEFDIPMLEILVCPLSKDKLLYNKKTNSLDSKRAGLSYPIRDSIPVLIIAEATKI